MRAKGVILTARTMCRYDLRWRVQSSCLWLFARALEQERRGYQHNLHLGWCWLSRAFVSVANIGSQKINWFRLSLGCQFARSNQMMSTKDRSRSSESCDELIFTTHINWWQGFDLIDKVWFGDDCDENYRTRVSEVISDANQSWIWVACSGMIVEELRTMPLYIYIYVYSIGFRDYVSARARRLRDRSCSGSCSQRTRTTSRQLAHAFF